MTVAHVWFCLQFLVHLQKGQCESEPHQTKQKTFYLVEIKASELADFPGVNTPYVKTELFALTERAFYCHNLTFFREKGKFAFTPEFL